MSIADKLKTVAENEQKVYDAGKSEGETSIWNIITNNWQRTNYDYGFRNWVTPSIKPPRKIVAKNISRMFANSYVEKIEKDYFDISTATDAAAFANASQLREIEDIGFGNVTTYYQAFSNSPKLHTIARLGSLETTIYTQTFYNNNALQNITFSGVIGRDISFQHCPLSVTSLKSIVKHLKNYFGTADEYKYTLTVKTSAWEALEAEGLTDEDWAWAEETFGIDRDFFDDYLSWSTVVNSLRWNLVLAS